MSNVNQYSTLSEALNDLNKRGYTNSINIDGDKAVVMGTNEKVSPEDVVITEYHRFEGDSNPDDMSVVYAIESTNGLKGVLIDAYGAYSNDELSTFLRKVKIKNT